jgi:hypothetical protein
MSPARGIDDLLAAARRVLCLGIGGGGDVVGALAVAELARLRDADARVGGVTWERTPVDPIPGPRRLDEIEHAEPLSGCTVLAGPDTVGPGGFRFAESHMARVLGEPTVLLDPHPGPAGIAAGLDGAARALDCDLIVLVDVGGDVLCHGDEPGLGSPLCDALLLAAGTRTETPAVLAVFGPACDGELTIEEVLARTAEVAAAGGLLGAWGLTPAVTDKLAAAVEEVPTEASAQAIACARGGLGPAPIRGGRRSVPLSPIGAVTFFYDVHVATASAARLARAVGETGSLEEANQVLRDLGVLSELDWETEHAPGRAS